MPCMQILQTMIPSLSSSTNLLCVTGVPRLAASAPACAIKAMKLHVLEYIAGMLRDPGMKSEGLMAVLCRKPLQLLMAAYLAAIDMPPATIMPAEMTSLVQCLEGIYDGECLLFITQ